MSPNTAELMTEQKAADFVKSFDLAIEVQTLKARKPWPQKLTSNMLLKSEDLRILLIAMESGARMEEHHSDGRISIQLLEGSVRIRVQQQMKEISAGNLLAIDRSVKHDVEATEDSVLLLTIAWPSNNELAEMKHRGYGS
jgi:quercetin dioxygenase-like cupin family protein